MHDFSVDFEDMLFCQGNGTSVDEEAIAEMRKYLLHAILTKQMAMPGKTGGLA